MFHPIKGGSKLTIGDGDSIKVDVHLPPVGYVWNYHTEQLEPTEIICRSTIKAEQFWERPKQPTNYSRRSKREKEKQKTDPEHFDPELREYRAREWHRRLYGAWFMNNGEYVFLPGPYYFYLAHWTIDVGAPKYKRADLRKAYFWEYCCQDPLCYGMVEMTKRRVGKTYFGACMLYEYVSRNINAHAGIQSKLAPDAKKVFQEKLIQPWRKLIDFFRPEFDTSKGDVPKSELRFFKPSKKGSNVDEDYDEAGELESWIDFGSSDIYHYDGQKMLRYLCDEVFKTTEVDVLKRHDVIKPCLENEDGEIIGKAIYTSTVEDMEGQGFLELYTKLWEQSDMNKRNKNGRTESGLYRWFTAAQEIMYVDKYGNPDIERALESIANELEGKSDPRKRSDYIRKFPRTWEEAFRSGSQDCLFDAEKLDDRATTLRAIKEANLFTRCNIIPDTEVPEGELPRMRIVKHKNGRWRLSNKFLEWFEGQENDVMRRGSQFLPKNNLKFVMGVDPFDHNRTKDGHFSQGAAAIYMKFDPLNQDLSDNFIGYYIGRPSKASIFYDDILKMCHYLSCQMLYEDQKPNIENHFVDEGYGAFLVRDSKGNPGISASGKTHQIMSEHIEAYIDDNCHRCIFLDMINDWTALRLDDTTKYDLAMATGYALIAASNIRRKEKKLSVLNKAKPTSLVRKYKLGRARARRGFAVSRSRVRSK